MKRSFLNRARNAFRALFPTGEKRSFNGAQTTNTTADWPTATTSADYELRNNLGPMRARCRQLERDNDYAVRFLKLLDNNVVGSNGIRLNMEVKDPSGKLDTVANDKVESGWLKWSKKKNCTTTKDMTWNDVCSLALRSAARDGSCLVLKIVGKAAGNEFGFALKLLEGDHLDQFFNGFAPNGNEVRMGVEYDSSNRRAAYWITPNHPGDFLGFANRYGRQRIDASEVIHLFRRNRIGQSDGSPWMGSSMVRLNHLGKYEEAEVIAARVGACKEGYIQLTTGEEYKGDGLDANGNQIEDMEPGRKTVLPNGATYVESNPTHPTTAYGDFVKGCLRGIASGLGVSYNTLANDLENVNYSSIRGGLLEEREEWMKIQNWLISDFCQEVFDAWLPLALLSGQVQLPFAKLEKFDAATWTARRWAWVDPKNDIESNILSSENYLKSPQEILVEQGKDPDTVLNQIKEWQEMIADKGLPPIQNDKTQPPPGTNPPAAPAKKQPAS